MRLYDCAKVMRSKNAGPFTITIDLMFEDQDTFEGVLASPAFAEQSIANLYGIATTSVSITPFYLIRTIKVSFSRPMPSSGSPADRDVYGCQQHFPLANLDINTSP